MTVGVYRHIHKRKSIRAATNKRPEAGSNRLRKIKTRKRGASEYKSIIIYYNKQYPLTWKTVVLRSGASLSRGEVGGPQVSASPCSAGHTSSPGRDGW